jgi:KipI family sensor histidine kinase inhibitor
VPLGDAAAYAEFSETLDLEVNEVLQRLAATLRARQLPWIRDLVPALGGLALHFDLSHPALPASPLEAAAALVQEGLDKPISRSAAAGRLIDVPVCYDPVLGIDLEEVAQKTRLPPQEVVRRHAAGEHRVLMVGFSPGQPYIGGLDAKLSLPRRAEPRTRVPAGAVAIANAQTAIYSFETPGGWHVIGRTPLVLFDPKRAPPSLFAPGDRVKFIAITLAEYERSK